MVSFTEEKDINQVFERHEPHGSWAEGRIATSSTAGKIQNFPLPFEN
jgi:hypothetical protein